MSETCNLSCSSCADDCADRKEAKSKNEFSEQFNSMSSVKKVIGVISGKGGVGKSLVTSMLAVSMNRLGYNSAILDADITGPSIPKAFGLKGQATGTDFGILPMKSKTGINIMSTNFLLANETDPVVWRGPIIAGTVKQFWTEVVWGDVDFMFIDMPPGTGDVPLTVFQSLAVDGIVIVTSPQDLVSMIVTKAIKMANMMNIPIIGIVENMSYFKCPDNDITYHLFGESKIEAIGAEQNIKVLAKLPIDPKFAAACDRGMIELYDSTGLDLTAQLLSQMI